MSLLSYVQADSKPVSNSGLTVEYQRERAWLRDRLYQRMPSERMAALLASDEERAKREIADTLRQILSSAHAPAFASDKQEELIREILDMVVGLGPLEELLADESVSEIMVNGPRCVFFERAGRLQSSNVVFADEQQLRMVIERIVGPLGRRVDEQSPLVSARLPQGHRVNVVIPPLSLDGPVVTIRKFREQMYTLAEMASMRSMSPRIVAMLKAAVATRRNIAVSGGTGSGKTTLLNALSAQIPANERIITIEDAAELRFHSHPHVVRLEARMKNAEGKGEVTIRDLVINALRMRPDRIIVGECRGAEALDMLQAMNTGHDGSLTTLHANSPSEVVSRLVMMSRYGMDLPVSVIEEQIASALDIIIQLDRFNDGSRRITSICECSGAEGRVELNALVSWDHQACHYRWNAIPTWFEQGQQSEAILDCEVEAC